MAADQVEPDHLMAAPEAQPTEELETSRRRHRMTIAGAQAVPEGKVPAQVEKAVSAVRDRAWQTA